VARCALDARATKINLLKKETRGTEGMVRLGCGSEERSRHREPSVSRLGDAATRSKLEKNGNPKGKPGLNSRNQRVLVRLNARNLSTVSGQPPKLWLARSHARRYARRSQL